MEIADLQKLLHCPLLHSKGFMMQNPKKLPVILKYGQFRLDIMKQFFTMMVVKHGNILPRGDEFPTPSHVKSYCDSVKPI